MHARPVKTSMMVLIFMATFAVHGQDAKNPTNTAPEAVSSSRASGLSNEVATSGSKPATPRGKLGQFGFEPGHAPIQPEAKGEPGFKPSPMEFGHTDGKAMPYRSGRVYDSEGKLLGDGIEYAFKEDCLLPLETTSKGQAIVVRDQRPAEASSFPHCYIKVSKAYTPAEARDLFKTRQPRRIGTNSWFSGTGYFTVVTDVMAGSMRLMLCEPDTEIDITQLRESGSELVFLGRLWKPKPTGTASIFLTANQVIGVNVTEKPAAP